MSVVAKSIFYDPRGRRARWANGIVVAAALVSATILAVVGGGLVIAPSLPRLSASPPVPPTTRARQNGATWTGQQFSPLRNRRVPAAAIQAKRFAFYANDDPGSLISLRQHAAELDAIIPDWIFFSRSARGIAQDSPAREDTTTTWLRRHVRHLEIYPQLASNLRAAETAALIATSAGRARIAEEVASYLHAKNYQGVTVALPELPATAHANLVLFLSALAKKLHADGRKVILVLPPVDVTSRTRELAKVVDYILLSTYEGSDDRHSGPIASQGWFERQLANQFSNLDRNKLIVGLGSYGFDWDGLGRKRQIAVQTAWDTLRHSGATLSFDVRALNSHFSYQEQGGLSHDVWYLDAVTVHNQARSALSLQPAGVAVWRLGLEDPGVWASVGRGRVPDSKALDSLRRPQPGNDIYSLTKGDVIDFGGPGASGKRTISYDDDLGLALGQSLDVVPRQVQLSPLGFVDKKLVALTFDDGPDPRFTPKILDLLAEKNVKATFFVIGKNAVANPTLLKRIYEEGNDLGNHTYSHPDMLENAGGPIELELNGTQRVLESLLGRHSIFFRPPYASRKFLQQAEAPRIVESASRLGYLTVSASVDPYDWSGPTTQQIIDRITNQIEDESGQIVLLHDSGGDRRLTIAALPVIIDKLRERGFEFVTLHELIGKSREEVMPFAESTSAFSRIGQNIRSVWFAVLPAIQEALPIVVVTATLLGASRLLLIIAAAYVHKRRERARASLNWTPASLAILVPAYNEAKVICNTIQALLASSGNQNFDILVVDDGSTDGTADVARRAFSTAERVKIHTKPNGGKAAALNFALKLTDAEVIVAIDADTLLMPNAVDLLTRHFADPSVGAVAGTAVVGNQINLITRFQALEYATSQSLDRRAFELFNAIGVVPGAVGAWRREALMAVGGYASDTLAEDADVTLALERGKWKVIYEPRALARTEAPESCEPS